MGKWVGRGQPLIRRMLSRCEYDHNGCLIFGGTKTAHFGYGKIMAFGRRQQKAHRVMWIITKGSIPEGMEVLHKCDNPPCVNPDHLFLGTQKDNIHDMITKGRFVGRRKVN